MTDKELKRLKRAELLQLLLTQSREIDRLRNELEEANKKLNEREIRLEHSGSIAEAALSIRNVFEDAQAAAEVYLDNVRRKSEELIASMTPENAEALTGAFANDITRSGGVNSSPGGIPSAPHTADKGVNG